MSGRKISLDRPLFLAIAVVYLILFAFELSHDLTLWLVAGGVLGIIVLVATAFSIVERALLHLGGAIALALLVPDSFLGGHYVIGVGIAIGAVVNAGMAFEQWQSGDKK